MWKRNKIIPIACDILRNHRSSSWLMGDKCCIAHENKNVDRVVIINIEARSINN